MDFKDKMQRVGGTVAKHGGAVVKHGAGVVKAMGGDAISKVGSDLMKKVVGDKEEPQSVLDRLDNHFRAILAEERGVRGKIANGLSSVRHSVSAYLRENDGEALGSAVIAGIETAVSAVPLAVLGPVGKGLLRVGTAAAVYVARKPLLSFCEAVTTHIGKRINGDHNLALVKEDGDGYFIKAPDEQVFREVGKDEFQTFKAQMLADKRNLEYLRISDDGAVSVFHYERGQLNDTHDGVGPVAAVRQFQSDGFVQYGFYNAGQCTRLLSSTLANVADDLDAIATELRSVMSDQFIKGPKR
jgi:hypothetical protein